MSKKILQAAAGAAGGESVYVDDVFSTYLYEGNGATGQSIVNGIDLSGEGGLVWGKSRDSSSSHSLYDTERGVQKPLLLNTSAEQNDSSGGATRGLYQFNSDGFTIGEDWAAAINLNNDSTVSWSFRKQAGFFDVVTYTGNGTAGRTISHNLGSTPAFIIVKRLEAADEWTCYVSSLGATKWMSLNQTAAAYTSSSRWNDTEPTDSVFTVGTDTSVNRNTSTYVAYLFAHDDQSFGDNSDESIIKCGSYTGNGNADGPEIDLGWEPQWLMIKSTTLTQSWLMLDVMRGFIVGDAYTGVAGSADARLYANLSSAEDSGYNRLDPTSTGFKLTSTASEVNSSGANYIYIAIRRPMKTPESGTEVYNADYQGNGTTDPAYVSDFVTDFGIRYFTPGGSSAYPITGSRLTGTNRLTTSSTAAQVSQSSLTWDYMNGWYNPDSASSSVFSHMFKRATGFFDVVAYTGDRSSFFQTITHNLQVSPELVIIKARNNPYNWFVNTSHLAAYNYGLLNLTNAFIFGTAEPDVPIYDLTETTFKVGDNGQVNATGGTFIAYLFATLDGVSKVGSYTGTGSNVDVDCGFSAGARFILIKRTDSTGDWYVWDSERGIVAGNDPYLLLNSTAAEVTSTDYIDPLSSGFTVTSSAPAGLNASGGTYIFLAIS